MGLIDPGFCIFFLLHINPFLYSNPLLHIVILFSMSIVLYIIVIYLHY